MKFQRMQRRNGFSGFRMNRTLKRVLSLVLMVAMIALSVAGTALIVKQVRRTDKTIHPAFTLGTLDANGKYKESKTTFYTKNAFKCQGLTVTPEFDSNVKFKVYYYDADGNYIANSATEEMSAKHVIQTNDAVYARIVLIPKEGKIYKFYDAIKMQNLLNITVDKDQRSVEEKNILEVETTVSGVNTTYALSCDFNDLHIVYEFSADEQTVSVVYYDVDENAIGDAIEYESTGAENGSATIHVPKDAKTFIVTYSEGATVYAYGK